MSVIAGSVPVTGFIAPTDSSDTYGTHDEKYGIGGYQSVADYTERDNITTERRKEGMLVRTLSTNELWQLSSDLLTWFLSGGSSATTLTGDVIGSGSGNITTTLANSGVLAGTYGSASIVCQITVDSKGRITSATAIPIQIAESQVTGLVGKYIPLTQKGANNGVATLDSAGHVPAGELNFSVVNLINTYNAATNTPALANGVGTVGDGYLVTTAGTHNFGAGNITFAIGDSVIYFATNTWQKVSTVFTGIQQITTDAGVLTGAAITLNDTTFIAPSTDRQYNTDDEKDALDNSLIALTSANPVVSKEELNSAIAGISVTREFNTPENFEDGLNSLGTNTISPQFMNTLVNPLTGVNYTTASMLAAYPASPGSWTAATTTYSDVCVNAAMRAMELAYGSAVLTCHDNRIYSYNQGVTMATISSWSSFFRPDTWLYQLNGSRHFNISGVAKPIWKRIPPDQTAAVGSSNPYTSYKVIMYNGSFYGAGLGVRNNGDNPVTICATYGGMAQNCVFTSGDTGLGLYFCLGFKVIGGSMGGNSRSGIKVATGFNDGVAPPMWTGATLTNSASNGTSLKPTNINCLNNSFAGIEIYGSDGCTVGAIGDQVVFEGSGGTKPDHHLYYDGQASTLNKIITFNQFHLEQDVNVSHFCVKDYGQEVTAICGYVSPFLTTANQAMFEARTNPAGGGTVKYIISNCPNLDVGWKFRQIGGGSSGRWTVSMCQLYDQSNIYASANWDTSTIGGLTGVIPPSPFAQILAVTP